LPKQVLALRLIKKVCNFFGLILFLKLAKASFGSSAYQKSLQLFWPNFVFKTCQIKFWLFGLSKKSATFLASLFIENLPRQILALRLIKKVCNFFGLIIY
jgi:hypothetical protein